MKIINYHIAKDTKEAYNILNEFKGAAVIGGGAWMRLSNRIIEHAIDLSKLGLDKIVEKDDRFEIGCMTTLRDIETNDNLNEYFNGVIGKSFNTVMGVQVRNIATIGGTIAGKLGFSDILTPLLVLNVELEFYENKKVSLDDFLNGRGFQKDILLKVIVYKDNRKVTFHSLKKTSTDFAVLNTAVSLINGKHLISIGARPGMAKLAYKAMEYADSIKQINEESITEVSKIALKEMTLGSNYKASKEYREQLCKVFVKRAMKEVHNYES